MTLLATTHALLGGPALALGVAAGFTAALASAVSYFISRQHGNGGGSSLRLLVLSHALMGAVDRQTLTRRAVAAALMTAAIALSVIDLA